MTGPRQKRPPVMAPVDGVRQTREANPQARRLTGVPGFISDQIVQPIVDHPILTALSMNPVGGAVMTGLAAHDVAGYAGQKAAELSLSPHDRQLAEADPDRIPGERAGVEAALLAAAPLLHASLGKGAALPESIPHGEPVEIPSSRYSDGAVGDPENRAILERPEFTRFQNRATRGGVSRTGPFLQGDQPQGMIALKNQPTRGGIQKTGPFAGGPRAGQIDFPSGERGAPGDLLTEEQRALLDRLGVEAPSPTVNGVPPEVPTGAGGAETLARLGVRRPPAAPGARGLGSPGYIAPAGGLLAALLGDPDGSRR